jgi:ABC-type multidrug transport system fused ATPase/permease subunit
LCWNLRLTIQQIFRTVVAFGLITVGTPVVLAAILPLAIIYYLFQRIYISTSRQLKRIDSTSRSPIYNHFSETVNGATSIRAYGACDQFIQESNRRVDNNHMCYFPSFTASRWLATRLQFLGYCKFKINYFEENSVEFNFISKIIASKAKLNLRMN